MNRAWIDEPLNAKKKHQKIINVVSNWRNIIIISVAAMTLKVMAEQLVLIFIRNG